MQLGQIQAIFFDVVGTTLFPNPAAPAVYAKFARENGLDLPEGVIRERLISAYQREEQIDSNSCWHTSEKREEQRWFNIVSETLAGVGNIDGCFQKLFYHFALPASWRLGQSVAQTLTELKSRGLTLGLGSNYDSRIWSVVAGFPELYQLRDRLVVSSAIGYRKPAYQFFVEITRQADCEPGEILFVGDDRQNDYDGATQAGLQAVLFDPSGRVDDCRTIRCLSELSTIVANDKSDK